MTEEGSLRVWHIVNVPREPFRYDVTSTTEAINLLRALADLDLLLPGDGAAPPATVPELYIAMQKIVGRYGLALHDPLHRYAEYLQRVGSPQAIHVITNAQGLEVFEEGGWVEWLDNEGDDISEVMRTSPRRLPLKAIGFPVTEVTVLQTRGGTDCIVLSLDGPTTFPACQYSLTLKVDAQKGHGVQWVRDNLGLEPRVVETS